MDLTRDERFLSEKYIKNLFPMIFSVLGGTINALIDSVMVSQRLGSDGLAAVNMSMPVYLVLCTFGAMISGGASVLSAQEAGKEQMDRAEYHYKSAMTLCFGAGILLTAIGCATVSPIAHLIAQGTVLEGYVYGYCLVTVIGALPALLAYLPISYLQLDGKTRDITGMVIVMVAADVLLDYLLMFVLDYGIYGAAAASLISTTLSSLYGLIRLQSGITNYHFGFCRCSLSEMTDICRIGSPSALGNLVDAVKLLSINAIVLSAGGAGAASIWAVLNTLSELSIAITSGVPQAAAPMMSAFYAAKENSGVRMLMKFQMRTGLALAALYGLALAVFSGPLANVFAAEGDLLLPLSCLGVFVVLDLANSVFVQYFNATARVTEANLLIVCRKLAFPVALIAVFAACKIYLWAFLPAAGAASLLAYLAMTRIVYQKYRRTDRPLSRYLLLDDRLEREHKVLDFSIAANEEDICEGSEKIKGFCIENEMNRKQTLKIQLAIEELLTIVVEKNAGIESVDLRVFNLDGVTGIRIRCAGTRYNPFEHASEGDSMMGIAMLAKMAEAVYYTFAMGINTINIFFEKM